MNSKFVFKSMLNQFLNNRGFRLFAFAVLFTGCAIKSEKTGENIQGMVSLWDYEWTQHYDWIRDFKYNRIPIKNISNLAPPDELFVPAYTLEMIEDYVYSLRSLPWVMPTASADENMILGKTPGWPEGKELIWPDDKPLQKWEELDPFVPPQNIYGFMITDPDSDRDKIKVILTGGIHPVEYIGNWALHAMLEFLIDDNPQAREIRRNVIFYVYPCINTDGRYLAQKRLDLDSLVRLPGGLSDVARGNPELFAGGEIDQNRVWLSEGKFVIIDKLKKAIKKDTGGEADYSWDFHGGFRLRHDYRGLPDAMETLYSGALKQREPTIPRRVESQIYDVRFQGWLLKEANVKYPFTYEPHALMDKERLFEVGRSFALAFYDVVAGTAPHPADVKLPGPQPKPDQEIRSQERARRLTENSD